LIGFNHSKHPIGTTPQDCDIVGNVFYVDAESDDAAGTFMVLVSGDEPVNWTWRDNFVSPAIAGDFAIPGVVATDLELRRPHLAFSCPSP